MKTTKERDTEAAFITEALDAEADAIRHVCERAGTVERTNWQDAIDVLKPLGFEEYLIPGYGVDPDGSTHDMSKLVFTFQ